MTGLPHRTRYEPAPEGVPGTQGQGQPRVKVQGSRLQGHSHRGDKGKVVPGACAEPTVSDASGPVCPPLSDSGRDASGSRYPQPQLVGRHKAQLIPIPLGEGLLTHLSA